MQKENIIFDKMTAMRFISLIRFCICIVSRANRFLPQLLITYPILYINNLHVLYICIKVQKIFGLRLLCKRPEVFMTPCTFQKLNSFLN